MLTQPSVAVRACAGSHSLHMVTPLGLPRIKETTVEIPIRTRLKDHGASPLIPIRDGSFAMSPVWQAFNNCQKASEINCYQLFRVVNFQVCLGSSYNLGCFVHVFFKLLMSNPRTNRYRKRSDTFIFDKLSCNTNINILMTSWLKVICRVNSNEKQCKYSITRIQRNIIILVKE